jgi:hypothetical protein
VSPQAGTFRATGLGRRSPPKISTEIDGLEQIFSRFKMAPVGLKAVSPSLRSTVTTLALPSLDPRHSRPSRARVHEQRERHERGPDQGPRRWAPAILAAAAPDRSNSRAPTQIDRRTWQPRATREPQPINLQAAPHNHLVHTQGQHDAEPSLQQPPLYQPLASRRPIHVVPAVRRSSCSTERRGPAPVPTGMPPKNHAVPSTVASRLVSNSRGFSGL